jgi:hypothetical protein
LPVLDQGSATELELALQLNHWLEVGRSFLPTVALESCFQLVAFQYREGDNWWHFSTEKEK